MAHSRRKIPLPVTIILSLGLVIALTTVIFEYRSERYSPELRRIMKMSLAPQEKEEIYHGALQNIGYPQFCLHSLYNRRKHNEIGVRHCPVNIHDAPDNQNWAITKSNFLRRPKGGCIEGTRWGLVQMTSCNNNSLHLFWIYDAIDGIIYHHSTGKCLEIDPDDQKVYLMHCDINELKQKWQFTYNNSQDSVDFVEYSDLDEMTMDYEA